MAISEWIGDSGPLVCLEESTASGWLGIWRLARDGESPEATSEGRGLVLDAEIDPPSTDYARACEALEAGVLAALIDFEGGTALALETTGHQAAFLATPNGAIIAKWVAAPTPAVAESVLAALDADSLVWEPLLDWSVRGRIVLTPAADRGGLVVAHDLPPGTYALSYAPYARDPEAGFELFRLERRD